MPAGRDGLHRLEHPNLWLSGRSKARIEPRPVALTSPTFFEGVVFPAAARAAVEQLRQDELAWHGR